ncbi:type VII secretion target [Actinophytocola sp.]|uniref:type VII secretion target n=1 Tax=Actinophytocola sp. TaxID=1872138 RepID=UPI002ED8EA1F
MTGFSVQPPALRELAGLLDRAQEDVRAGRKYLQEGVSKISGEGVINRITDSHDAVVHTLDTWLGEVADGALAATSTAVTDAAGYYERTDQASAAQLDATYPAAELTDAREHTDYVPIEPPEGTGRFGDVVEPQEHLTDVKDYSRELDGTPNWWDAFSPMVHIGNAIESVTWLAAQLGWIAHPIDPQAEIVKPWVGDWAGVRAAADVFESLGQLSRRVAININWASQSTEDVWKGHAGEGCALYLMNLGRPLNDAWRPLDELSKQYKTASEEMVTLRDAVVNVLNQIGDAAIEAAVAAGIGGGAASTGVGAPIAIGAGLFAAWKIKRVVDGVSEIFGLIGQLDTALSVVKAAQTDFGGLSGHASMPRLPPHPETPR